METRKDAGAAPPEYAFGAFVLQPATRRLLRADAPVSCPRLVFDLLHDLIAHRERAIGRDELALAVWRRADVADVQIGQIVLRAPRGGRRRQRAAFDRDGAGIGVSPGGGDASGAG